LLLQFFWRRHTGNGPPTLPLIANALNTFFITPRSDPVRVTIIFHVVPLFVSMAAFEE
jgi:hypothetical protein